LERFEKEGLAGLEDRSHEPHECPHRLSDWVIEEILAVRYAHPSWGPKKIRGWLVLHWPDVAWPALSTIGELLKARGLSVARKKRSRVPASAPFGACLEANDTWTIDFKGWFRTADGRRCDPLTLQDAHSRYLLRCQIVERPDRENVWPILDAAFREFGLPRRLRSDNGAPFASTAIGGLSQMSINLIKTGVVPERIAPGEPQQNGRHERMHLTLQCETANPPAASPRAQQRRFEAFRKEYNEERPHEALGQTPPVQHFAASDRRYNGRLREPEYQEGIEVRRVRHNGEIKWRGDCIYIGQVLSGEPIACEESDDGSWLLRYGPIELGKIDDRGRLCVPRRRRGTHNRPPS
jgi:transposase InsO family protein